MIRSHIPITVHPVKNLARSQSRHVLARALSSIDVARLLNTGQQRKQHRKRSWKVPVDDHQRKKFTLDDWLLQVQEEVGHGRLTDNSFISSSFESAVHVAKTQKADSVAAAVGMFCLLLEHTEGMQQLSAVLLNVYRTSKSQPDLGRELQMSRIFHEEYHRAVSRACTTEVLSNPSTTAHLALAQLYFGIMCPEFWLRVCHVMPSWESLSAADLHGLLNSAAKLKISTGLRVSRELVSAFLQKVHATAPSMCGREVSETLWAFSKIGVRRHCIPEPLLQSLSSQSKSMDAYAVAQSLYALSLLRIAAASVPQFLIQAVARVASDMDPQGVANTLHAWAKLGMSAGSVPQSLLQAVPGVADGMNPQNVSNTLWAWAKLGMPKDSVPQPLLQSVCRVAKDMSPQGVSSTLWAWAALGMAADSVPESLLQAVRRVASSMNRRAVSNTVWACDTLGLNADSMFA